MLAVSDSRLAGELFGSVPVSRTAASDLRRRLTAPDRHYHSLCHVVNLWRRHLHFGSGTFLHAPRMNRLIAAAIAYHDAVYDPQRNDNERCSALLWRYDAGMRGMLNPADIDWVAETIEATAGHVCSARGTRFEAARCWVLDLDLTPLGERPSGFDRGTAALRREHRHLDQPSWNRLRLNFLSGLNDRPRIYRIQRIAAAFEKRARANCRRELAHVDACTSRVP